MSKAREAARRVRRQAEPSANGHRHLRAFPVPESGDLRRLATIADLIRKGAEEKWLWPGYIQTEVVNFLSSRGGVGKTRFLCDLMRRVGSGLSWPDGQPITFPSDSRFLWVAADQQHNQLASIAKEFNLRQECLVLNDDVDDGWSGTCLDSQEDLSLLEASIHSARPIMVIIDTVSGSTNLDLATAEGARRYYEPLSRLARKYKTAVVAVTHLSRHGEELGLRVRERVRCGLRLELPDPNDKRLKLFVSKSTQAEPPALGVTIGKTGIEYDRSPPKDAWTVSQAVTKCAALLRKILIDGPRKKDELRKLAIKARHSTVIFGDAMKFLDLVEFDIEEDRRGKRGRKGKWVRLPKSESGE
jgi:hypothetical protein